MHSDLESGKEAVMYCGGDGIGSSGIAYNMYLIKALAEHIVELIIRLCAKGDNRIAAAEKLLFSRLDILSLSACFRSLPPQASNAMLPIPSASASLLPHLAVWS